MKHFGNKFFRDTFGFMHMTASNEFVTPGKRTAITDDFRIELDLSSQVLAIYAPVDKQDSLRDDETGGTEAPLSPMIEPNTFNPTTPAPFISASVLAHKAKIFDDGLYAAVELAAQNGAGRHAGKAAILQSIGSALANADPAVAGTAQELLFGAARLGQVPIANLPPTAQTSAQRASQEFLADKVRSTPIGFYTWSRQLESIFQQDRMLQGRMNSSDIRTLVSILRANPSARATYERHLRLVSHLTNPLAHSDLRSLLEGHDDSSQEDSQFFPPSVSHETTLMKKLFGVNPIPEGFVLADEMIRQIRARLLNLEPTTESGWYDYQTWALEPLVIPELMPEGKYLQLDDEYRKLLLELFKGLLTLTRGTHIKQLESPRLGATMRRDECILIQPVLSAEPLATCYLRRALGYRYIKIILKDAFGPSELERLHRLTETGPVLPSLAKELAGMETLFLGAHVIIHRELGLPPDAATGSKTAVNKAAERFSAWARKLESDPDLRLDLRGMVPVFYDRGRKKLKVWAFLGWAKRPIRVTFSQPPRATVRSLHGNLLPDAPPIRWGGLYSELPYPVTAEVYVDRILNRTEFRKLCDTCGTRSEILKCLTTSTNSA